MRRRLFSICIVTAACSSGSGSSDARECPIGDVSAVAELQLFQTIASGELVQIQPMDNVALLQPPQGGWVFYIAPHVRNLDGCSVQLTTSLIDSATNQVVVFESRPSTMEDDGTGWGVPINQASDGLIAACPQTGITRNLYDESYLLDVRAVDSVGRQAETKVPITPTCADPFCRCQCDHTYQLGQTCPP